MIIVNDYEKYHQWITDSIKQRRAEIDRLNAELDYFLEKAEIEELDIE